MHFKQWFENLTCFSVSVNRLYGWRYKVLEAIQEVQAGQLSYTEGPLTVSRLDSPRGSFFVMDGHHRLIQEILAGKKMISVNINEFVPRIERTGGSHREMVAQKVLIAQAVLSSVPR